MVNNMEIVVFTEDIALTLIDMGFTCVRKDKYYHFLDSEEIRYEIELLLSF